MSVCFNLKYQTTEYASSDEAEESSDLSSLTEHMQNAAIQDSASISDAVKSDTGHIKPISFARYTIDQLLAFGLKSDSNANRVLAHLHFRNPKFVQNITCSGVKAIIEIKKLESQEQLQ